MEKDVFREVVGLLGDFTIEELRSTRSGIILILKHLNEEIQRVCAEVYRTMHHFDISVQSKKRRVRHIDEHLLSNVSAFNINIISDFSDSKSNTLTRIQTLQKEKKRIQKNANEHALKAQMNLRDLRDIHKEREKIERYLTILEKADIVHKFVKDNRINVVGITKEEVEKLYKQYMNRGGR